jgi:hypothetical protein
VGWGVLIFLVAACVSSSWSAGLCQNTAKLSDELWSFEKLGQDLKVRFLSCLVDGWLLCRLLGLLVTDEEKGLMGSEYYSDNPVYFLENTVANLNIDIIGRLDEKHKDNPDYIYLIGSNRLSTELHEISEYANKTYINIQLDYSFNSFNDPNRFYYRSGHYNFAKNNIPVIFYFNGVHEDYHKPTDTADKIIFSKVEKITRLVFYTAWELASREKRIEVNLKGE